MIVSLLGKRQRTANQTRDTLPERVVKPLDVRGFTGQFADRMVLRSGNDTDIDHILVRIKSGMLTVRLRNLFPQLPGAFAAAVPDVQANDVATLGVHRHPYPLLVRLLLHKTRHCVGFDLKTLDHDGRGARDRLDIAMIGQRLKLGDTKPQQPCESYPHRPANPPEGQAFEHQALNKATRVIRDEVLLEAIDKLTATVLALVVLFAGVNVTILLLFGGRATRTDISDDHSHG